MRVLWKSVKCLWRRVNRFRKFLKYVFFSPRFSASHMFADPVDLIGSSITIKSWMLRNALVMRVNALLRVSRRVFRESLLRRCSEQEEEKLIPRILNRTKLSKIRCCSGILSFLSSAICFLRYASLLVSSFLLDLFTIFF